MNIPFLTEEWFIAIRRRLIRYFAVERCPDADDLAAETLYRVVKAISRGATIEVKPENYVFAVARHVLQEKRRESRKRGETMLDETTPEPMPPDTPSDEARHLCLERCLRWLAPLDRALIIAFYSGTEPGEDKRNRRALAEQLHMPLKTLRKRAMKIRQQLERCLDDCLGG
jgi:RNA polymerase sigma factor (sigma-70 family)